MHPNEQFIKNVEQLLQTILVEYNRLKAIYPPNDIRPAYFGLPGNTLHSLLLQLASANDTITLLEWWKIRYGREKLLPKDIDAINESGMLAKHSYMVFFFARIEHLQRKSINIISAGFDPNSTKPYKQVYDQYLTTLNLQYFIPLYDIVRHIRNSVHTNGYHIPHSGNNSKIVWKTKTFEFVHLKPIEVLSIENFIFLLTELIDSLHEIVNSPVLTAIPFIEDRFH